MKTDQLVAWRRWFETKSREYDAGKLSRIDYEACVLALESFLVNAKY